MSFETGSQYKLPGVGTTGVCPMFIRLEKGQAAGPPWSKACAHHQGRDKVTSQISAHSMKTISPGTTREHGSGKARAGGIEISADEVAPLLRVELRRDAS
jgi:hypothetical protein